MEGDTVRLSEMGDNSDLPVTITMENLSYYIDVPVRELSLFEKFNGLSLRGFPKPEVVSKAILSNLSGTIKPNTMTALMGPSGAGKSTLLDIIAGRKNFGRIEGTLTFNSRPRGADFKRIVGYVEQTDILPGSLTVREILMYTARLKLDRSTSQEKREQRVNDIIHQLGLDSCADTLIG
eukprot:Colp12_sorted_trinity150504_noHs@8848